MLKASAVLFSLGIGVMFGLYLTLNSLTARSVASPYLANVVFFAMGLVTALVLALAAGHKPPEMLRFAGLPWWMLTAGILSGLMILGSAMLIPAVGPGAFFVLFVAGQAVAGTVIGHYGWLGTTADPAGWRSLAGIALLVAGAWLVTSRG